MQIRNQGVLITGGSRGLGAALASELAAHGARVVVVARQKDELDALVERVRGQGGQIHGLAADVGDKEAIYKIAGAATALVGPITLLVHNASTLGPVPLKPLADTACEELEAVLATNLVGPFRLTKALLGSMALGRGGLVLHISSDAAINGYPNWGAYGVSKAALDHLARIWGAELDPAGVRFLSVDPGEMDTRMHADAIPEADRASLTAPAVVAARLRRIIERAETLPNGARLEAAEFAAAEPAAGEGAASAEVRS